MKYDPVTEALRPDGRFEGKAMIDGMTVKLMDAQSVTMVIDGTGHNFMVDLGHGVRCQFSYSGLKDVKILKAHVLLRVEFERTGDINNAKPSSTPKQ